MKNIEDIVSPLIQSQFPAFYNEEGPLFVDFVKAYYKWLESSSQQLYYSRNLLEYKDIDKTVESFLIHFKETFLKDLPLSVSSNNRLLVKNILSFYLNKGDEASVKTAIRALFNQNSSVYLPGDDVFKLSSGKWKKPVYLEVTVSSRNNNFVNKEIVGSSSGAKAYCENLVKKRINGKFIDVLFLSNVRGNFSFGEKVVEAANTNILNAPTVSGSLTTLTVTNGGQNFSVGDIFNIESVNGKNGKAIVTSISNETGRVNFSILDGGWGFSNTANVYVSDKVLRIFNVSNSNSSITNFERFETVSQNLMSIGFTSAVNANYFVANTIIFAQGNSTVSNSTAGIVSVTLVSNTEGIIKVTNLSGNVAATNNTMKASLVDLVFDTSSNISLITNGSIIESINSTSSSNAYVISATSSNSTHGSLLLRPISGNVASTNSTFRLATNNATTGTVNTYTSNLYFSATIANNSNITANGILIGQNSNYIGLDSVLNTFIPNTLFSYVYGLTSNTFANINFVSSGSDASFKIGSLDFEETVLLTPDLLSSRNTGNVPFLDVNLDLSPNNANAVGYGFVKFPGADVNTTLLDALRFESKVIGSISALNSINPGQEYNIDPFVLVHEKDVAGYKRRDFVIGITSPSRSFANGERVYQTSNSTAVSLTVNTFTGTAANGSSTTTFEIGEFVYQSNGSANIATGFVFSSGLSGGSGTVKLSNVSGTFQITPTNNYKLNTLTTNATCNISAIDTSTTISTTSYGQVKAGSNSSVLYIERQSFENTFGIGNTILGITSGASATISNVTEDSGSIPIGENASIEANVQVANSVVSGLSVFDSGFGYLDNENVTLQKDGSVYIVTAQTDLNKQGVGEGYYRDSGGFISDNKKLFDSDYYQDYSYEIQTKIPFSKYSEILKKILHVAGTKMFGKVVIDSFSNTELTLSNTSVKYLNIDFNNSTIGKQYTTNEMLLFSNGNSNSTLHYVNSTSVNTSFSSSNNIIVLEIPGNNNNFAVNRLVFSPNSESYTASGNLLSKSSDDTANITLLYLKLETGTFTSSNTIAGYVSSNTSNTTTSITTLTNAVELYGYGNVSQQCVSVLTVPVANTLSSLLTGTINISNSSVNVVGTSTSFNSNFVNNGFIQLISGGSTDIKQIKSVTNSTHMVLREYPAFTNSASTHKKSSPFISNTVIKMANASSNVALGNVFSFTSNSTYYTYYITNVSGSFKSSNTVEGYINSTTTNTYSLYSAINTLVSSVAEDSIPIGSVITGRSSNTSANISYLTVRLEK